VTGKVRALQFDRKNTVQEAQECVENPSLYFEKKVYGKNIMQHVARDGVTCS
jgi:hypothetical protein